MANFLLIASLIIIFAGITLSRKRFKDRALGRLALPAQVVGAVLLVMGNWLSDTPSVIIICVGVVLAVVNIAMWAREIRERRIAPSH